MLWPQTGLESDKGYHKGPILGPLLFLLYINDLPEILNWSYTPVIFADETSTLFSHSNINDLIKIVT
jgi:hypothetical protein